MSLSEPTTAGPTTRVRTTAAARLAAAAIAAFLYGLLTAHIPSPHDPGTFWVGNLAAPYLLLPFLAGAWHFGWRGAAGAGALVGAGLVCGFYNVLATAGVTNSMLGLPDGTPARTRLEHAYGGWLEHQVLGSGGFPWLTIGVGLGLCCGLAGFVFGARQVRSVGVLFALMFVTEPIVYLTRANTVAFPAAPYAWSPWNLAVWAIEATAGVVLIARFARARDHV